MSDAARPILFSHGGVDGGPRIEVSVAEDSMTAWATLHHGTSPGGKLLVWGEVAEALRNAGLGPGLLDRDLQDALFRFNTGHPAPETLVIARGTAPVAERPAYLKLEARFYQHHFVDKGGTQVDFKEFSPFLIVKKGELLARGFAARPGVPGLTVYGVEIPAGKKDIKILKPGPHTLFAHGRVFSRLAGRFTLEGDLFDVSDLLELEAGVGYATGNIVFPGTIVVKGVVGDGFRMAAGGSITVKAALDASEVLCHGDLTVEGGIIGKKPGVVRSGGTIKTLFIEHCQVESLGNVFVAKALLHAKLFTNANLTLDDGGRIVASTVWVRGVLTCAQLGGENGPVRVVAGSDFVVHRKMEAIRSKYKVLEDEILKDKKEGKDPDVDRIAALHALVKDLNELTPQLFSNPATEVRVVHRVFEGTVIEMGYASLTVTQALKAQVFRLAPDGKTVVASPWVKDPAPGA